MSLTVITHTSGVRPDLLKRCIDSVGAALPDGAVHKIIHTDSYEAWAESRVRSVLESDIACFVDDDDTIDPTVLHHCLAALKGNDLGVACSNELMIYPNGAVQKPQHHKTYEGILTSPKEIHHLCMMRGHHVDPKVLDDVRSLGGIGADWLVKASAALRGGAVHVPLDGYRWYINSPDSDIMRIRMRYTSTMPALTRIISRYAGRRGMIAKYDLSQTQLPA